MLDRCKGLRVGTLAERLAVTQQAAGKLLKNMEIAELVVITKDAVDGRARQARLTELGAEAVALVSDAMSATEDDNDSPEEEGVSDSSEEDEGEPLEA
ncbi:MarR family winged helix-turn-helix transcriptional regulator [Halioglobus sp. HI00S01]|uniref:MarR family winged helix-turn-helix transcriptional regulator n=1 Tax=Halioglobus sp. HI00S01 TaxID=1822214 RepID=UPI0018D3D466|nr:MarR family transcriptional regulator [Halioglobus sp. HI00S01]